MTTPTPLPSHPAVAEFLRLDELRTKGDWVSVACHSPKHAAGVAYKNEPGCDFIMVTGSGDTDEDADQRDSDADFIAAASKIAPEVRHLLVTNAAMALALDEKESELTALRKERGDLREALKLIEQEEVSILSARIIAREALGPKEKT